ncbi:MAG TPA: hypothetical protein VFS00_11555, partial [Polyangiaceae bacterium]|nr:hypothetical protein [Polyangiaceae bacterium]
MKRSEPAPRGRLAPLARAGALALLSLDCGPGAWKTADEWPELKRVPDGVALDRSPAPLQPSPAASSPGTGELALVPPPSPEGAFEALRGFFEAVTHEDPKALEATLAPNATFWSLGAAGRASTTPLLNLWRERFRRLNYTQLAEHAVLRQAEVEVLSAADLAALPPERRLASPDLGPRDLLLRVHVLVPRIGPERLLGDDLLLWLRPLEGRYLVQGSGEDFSLPL